MNGRNATPVGRSVPTRVCALVLLAVCAVAVSQTRPTGSPPSPDELRQMFDAENYRDVVRHVVKVLQLKGEAAAAYDRHELLVLKAEAHLRLGEVHLAAKTFDEAAGTTSDAIDAATARATAALIRRARHDGYAARTGPTAGEVLPIVEPDGRRLALKALYQDERDACARRLSTAQRADDLPGLLDGLDVVLHLREFELAAAGGELDARAALEPLADRAQDMLKDQLKTIASRADKLDKSANSKKKMGSHYRKRGLAKEEMTELRRRADDCRRLGAAAQKFVEAIGGDPELQSTRESSSPPDSEDFVELGQEAQRLANRIEAILSADYGGLYEKN